MKAIQVPEIIDKDNLKYMREPITVIFRESSMGDIIACEPIVDVVRKLYPKNKIAWMICRQFVDLLVAHPDIDYLVLTEDRDETIMFIKELGSNFRVIPLYMNFLDAARQKKYGGFLHVNRMIDANSYTHWGAYVNMYCRTAFLPKATRPPKFYFIDQKTSYAIYDRNGNWVKKYVVFHCLASKDTPFGRNWTTKGWMDLLEYFIDKKIHVVEIGLEAVIASDNVYYIDMTTEHSLQKVAKIIKGSSLFVGIDSGFAHVANALEVDGVLLFGMMRNYFRRHVIYAGKYRYNHILRARGMRDVSTITAAQVIRFIENKDSPWHQIIGYCEGFYNLHVYNPIMRFGKCLYRFLFRGIVNVQKTGRGGVPNRDIRSTKEGIQKNNKSLCSTERNSMFERLKRYMGKALRAPIHLAHVEELFKLERSNAAMLKSIQYFLVLKETCPEIIHNLMPNFFTEMTPEIQDYIQNGYYSQLSSIRPLNTQYLEIVRDSILNLLGTAQSRRDEFIEKCRELAARENVLTGIYVSLLKEMKMVAADQKILEEICDRYINSPAAWNKGSAQNEAWALCLGILSRAEKTDIAKLKELLTKHEKLYQLKGLERDLGAALLARRNGFANPKISDSALLLENAEENEKNKVFLEFVKDKRVAIVGNGPQELGSGNGEKIDAYDVVIRFNDFVTSPEFALDYGTKTDVWALAARLAPRDPANLKNIKIIFDPLGMRRFLYPQQKIDLLLRYLKGQKKIIVGIPEMFFCDLLRSLGFGRPTSGLIVAAYIKQINQKFSIDDIYGFSFKDGIVAEGKNQEAIAQHYYDSKPGIKMPHSTMNENRFFLKLFS